MNKDELFIQQSNKGKHWDELYVNFQLFLP